MKKQKLRRELVICMLILSLFWGITSVYSQQAPALGDVNSDDSVDIVDALLVAQYYVGLNPAGFNENAADVDESGSIDILDALLIARYFVGLIDTLPPGPTFLDNPFEGATWYVDPEWSARAEAGGGGVIAQYNTAITLYSVAAITNGTGLRGHMDNALAQNSNLILIGLYFLPGDCDLFWLDLYDDPFTWYTTEVIDPVVAILSNPLYRDIRKVMIIEPETLPVLITGMENPECAEMNGAGGFVDMIRYAINQLNTIPNVYNYVDIAFSGWLGWDDNFGQASELIASTIKGTNKGVNSISGFISNTFNYCPLEEPFLPDPDLEIGGSPVRASAFYEWNRYFGEMKYVQAMYAAFMDMGFPASIGMLINTSRNGWGGPDRPANVSASQDLDTYVNESRIDRRLYRGNYCNQPGGIGERPVANPAPHIDAYVWSWPPGVSDGISEPGIVDPDDPNKRFDQMCDPEGTCIYNEDFGTGAMPAPHMGHWNQAHFELLLQNAYPPLN